MLAEKHLITIAFHILKTGNRNLIKFHTWIFKKFWINCKNKQEGHDGPVSLTWYNLTLLRWCYIPNMKGLGYRWAIKVMWYTEVDTHSSLFRLIYLHSRNRGRRRNVEGRISHQNSGGNPSDSSWRLDKETVMWHRKVSRDKVTGHVVEDEMLRSAFSIITAEENLSGCSRWLD